MKLCPTCSRTYADLSLKFCMDDGTPLTDAPWFDTEAETLKNVPKQPELSPLDATMELANYLRTNIRPAHQVLIRFDQVAGLTTSQVSEHLEAAAEKADCEILNKTDTRATVRRRPNLGVLA